MIFSGSDLKNNLHDDLKRKNKDKIVRKILKPVYLSIFGQISPEIKGSGNNLIYEYP